MLCKWINIQINSGFDNRRNLDQRCERWLRFEVVLVREHDVN
jgi:hypothetical protein